MENVKNKKDYYTYYLSLLNYEKFALEYAKYLNEQIKPWLEGSRGILPEFDGYDYTIMDSGSGSQKDTRDIRHMFDDIFTFTANAFGIPPVLLLGDVAGTQDAMTRWL